MAALLVPLMRAVEGVIKLVLQERNIQPPISTLRRASLRRSNG